MRDGLSYGSAVSEPWKKAVDWTLFFKGRKGEGAAGGTSEGHPPPPLDGGARPPLPPKALGLPPQLSLPIHEKLMSPGESLPTTQVLKNVEEC